MSAPRPCAACGIVRPPVCFEHGYREKTMCRPCASQKHKRVRDRAGADPSEWPEDLRVREFPEARRG